MRIPPGGEITSLLQQTVAELGYKAAFIVSCVGSVKSVILRFATDSEGSHTVLDRNENLEICSLVGTLSKDGFHLHGTFGDAKGATVSGHIMGNMVVQTTAEIVIGNTNKFEFRREFDKKTGFNELVVEKKNFTSKNDSVPVDDSEFSSDTDSDTPVANVRTVDRKRNNQNSEDDFQNHGNSGPPVKKAYAQSFPTDKEIKTCVAKILKGSALHEITLKTVYLKVLKNYPGHDLADKKELIYSLIFQLM